MGGHELGGGGALALGVLEALLEFKPADRSEFQQRLPGYLREGTDPAEGRFIDDVLSLIGDYA